MIYIIEDNKDFPRFYYKTFENPLCIECDIEVSKNVIKHGRVINISSNGKYKVEVLDELE